MELIKKLQNAWSPLIQRQDNTYVNPIHRVLNPYAFTSDKEKQNIIAKNNAKGLSTSFNTDDTINITPNTTSDFINGKQNKNAKRGLTDTHPEFLLATAGVGSGLLNGVSGAMLHGAAQGALWNIAGVGGEQSLSGLTSDIIGGATVGGLVKGLPKITNYLKGEYYKNTFDPLTIDLKQYKGLVDPDSKLNMIDKLKSKILTNKISNLYTNNPGESSKVIRYENKLNDLKFENQLKQNSRLLYSSNTKLGKLLGEGSFGSTYEFKYNPDYVVKFGRPAPNENPLDLIAKGKSFTSDPNIGMPIRVEELSPNRYAWVMKKVKGDSFIQTSIPRSAIADAALKIRSLNKSGIGFDYVGQNMLYDDATKKFSLIDFNSLPSNYKNADTYDLFSQNYDDFVTRINKLKQNPVTELKDKFSWAIEQKPNKINNTTLFNNNKNINNNYDYLKDLNWNDLNLFRQSSNFKQGGKLIPKGQQGFMLPSPFAASPFSLTNKQPFELFPRPIKTYGLSSDRFKRISGDTDKIKRFANYFNGMGYNKIQLASILGSLYQESYLEPTQKQIGGGGGYGISQITNPVRKSVFGSYIKSHGLKPDSEEAQIKYLQEELGASDPNLMKVSWGKERRAKFLSQPDLDSATTYFTTGFLRPGKPELQNRKAYAQYIYDNILQRGGKINKKPND